MSDRFPALLRSPGALTIGLCVLHVAAILAALGGWPGLSSPWPLLLADHGTHFHHAVVARQFLATTGSTAGYDSSFMSGFAMSVFSDPSSTLSDVVVFVLGLARFDPAVAYKFHVFFCAAAVPPVVACAGIAWRLDPGAIAAAVVFLLIYFWTDFPTSYAFYGMLAYLIAVPLGLLTMALLSGYLDRGGFRRWLATALAGSVAGLAHPTSAMILVPSALAAYASAAIVARGAGRALPASRHVGVWVLPAVVLATNAFWLIPALGLLATKGETAFAFYHPEPVGDRLAAIFSTEPPIQGVLWGFGLMGLVMLARRDRRTTVTLGAFIAAGFSWGYLAGVSRSLDFLQPGRHTYALYTGAALAAGIGLSRVLETLRDADPGRLDRWLILALILVGTRLFGPKILPLPRKLTAPDSMFSSRPTPRLEWMVDRVRKYVRPGERLLYEEGGVKIEGLSDPFQGRNFSAIFPYLAGVEVIGGPYLHTNVNTNFTQFGEDKLFGQAHWDREFFKRYATIYRPSAILCWTPWARTFCKLNPDLVQIIDEDRVMTFGRIRGYDGATSRGTADVRAEPGRLRVRGASPGEDGLVVLRYHLVPLLVCRPPVPLEPVYLEDDPVPFIGLRARAGGPDLEIRLSPWGRLLEHPRWRGRDHPRPSAKGRVRPAR